MVKKILNTKLTLEAAGYKEADVSTATKFTIKDIHPKLRGN